MKQRLNIIIFLLTTLAFSNSIADELSSCSRQEFSNNAERIDYYQSIVKSSPNNAEAYISLGKAYDYDKKYDLAVTSFLEAEKLGWVAKADEALAMHYNFYDKNAKKSLEYYQKALKLEPNNIELITYLAALYKSSLDDSAKAISILEAQLKVTPDNMDIISTLTSTYIDDNQEDKAIELAKATMKSQNNIESLKLLADVYSDSGHTKDAVALLESGIAKYPADVNLKVDLAQNYDSDKQYDKAIILLKSITIKSNKQSSFYSQSYVTNLLAETYQDIGDNNKAIALLESNQKYSDDDGRLQLADAYIKNKELGKGFAIYLDVIEASKTPEMANFHKQRLAYIYSNNGLYNEAIDLYKNLLLNSKDKWLVGDLADVYNKANKPELAINLLENTIKTLKLPKENDLSINLNNRLANLYKSTNPEKAEAVYKNLYSMCLDKDTTEGQKIDIAATLLSAKKYDEVIEILDKSLSNIDNKSSKQSKHTLRNYILFLLAPAYSKTGNMDKAIELANSAKVKSGYPEYNKNNILALIYYNAADLDKAYYYMGLANQDNNPIPEYFELALIRNDTKVMSQKVDRDNWIVNPARYDMFEVLKKSANDEKETGLADWVKKYPKYDQDDNIVLMYFTTKYLHAWADTLTNPSAKDKVKAALVAYDNWAK